MSSKKRLPETLLRMSIPALVIGSVCSAIVGFDAKAGAKKWPKYSPLEPASETERIAAAQKYLDAVLHRAEAFNVPFAATATRYENGVKTGFNATHMQWELHMHMQYAAIKDLTVEKWTVEPAGKPGIVNCVFLLKTVFGLTIRVDEDFHIPAEDGRIHRIDGTLSPA